MGTSAPGWVYHGPTGQVGRDRIPAPNDMAISESDDDDDDKAGPYQAAAPTYYRAGWPTFPVTGKAINVPKGVTGRAGAPIEYATVCDWMVSRPDDNIAVRLTGVIGIDVDAYVKDGKLKRGDETLASAEHLWGTLPATWRSTSRDAANPSGIRFYRVPKGIEFRTLLSMPNADGEVTGDIEICQHSHRYAVVWPSINPDTGTPYRWYTPDGTVSLGVPDVLELPVLPPRWVDELTMIRPTVEERPAAPVTAQLALPADWHAQVTDHYRRGVEACAGPAGSRHDNTLVVVGALARDESRGRAGATTALGMLRERFVAAIGDDGQRDPAREFESMVESSRLLAATTVSTAEAELAAVAAVFANIPEVPEGPPAVAAVLDPPGPGEDPNRHRRRMLTEDALRLIPPPIPLAAGWFYRRSLAVLYGPPKKGKTFVAVDLALAVATGRPWMGGPTEAGHVVYCLGEGVAGLSRRLEAWRLHHGCDGPADLAILPHVPQLHNPVDVADFIEAVTPARPALIIIDTLARAIVGVDENASKDMGEVVAQLDRIKEATGACVLVLHHTGKDAARGTRGSSALTGAIDTGVEVRGDPQAMTLATTEQKDAEPADPRQFRAESVGDSIVLVPTLDLSRASSSTIAVMEALVEIDTGGTATTLWKDMAAERGVPERTFYRAVKWLVDNHDVENVGSQKRPLYSVRRRGAGDDDF